MTIPVFPSLLGVSWPVKRTPLLYTIRQPSQSGKETTIRQWLYPKYQYELTFDYLPLADWQNLEGFWLTVGGAAGVFYFNDPSDNAVTTQPFGTGDGTTTAFQLVRALGGFGMPVQSVNGAIAVYENGSLVSPGGYAVGSTGIVTFTTAPAAAQALTWSGAYYWSCRFDDDNGLEIAEFMNNLRELKKLAFTTVKL